jgi:hypothetical protein
MLEVDIVCRHPDNLWLSGFCDEYADRSDEENGG